MVRKNFVLLGHNRFGTHGKVSRANAHPFEFATLVGAHNGTLHNKYQLTHGNKYDTDSEALFHGIEDDGLEETIAKCRGAWSLTWYDKVNHSINFLRNKERPMFVTMDEAEKTIFWASEAWMLQATLSRAGIKYKQPVSTKEDVLISYEIPEDGKAFGKAEVRAVEGAPFTQPQHKPTFSVPTTTNTSGASTGTQDSTKKNTELYGKGYYPRLGINCCVFLKCIGWAKDKALNPYLVLTHPDMPDADIRSYITNSEEAKEYLDQEWSGIINKISFKTGRYVYKIKKDSLVKVVDLTSNDTIKYLKNGLSITKDEFNKLDYTDCAMCGNPIAFEEEWVDITKGIFICEDCSCSEEAQQYIH